MKVPSETSRTDVESDSTALQSFAISQLLPARIGTMENGVAGIHSPYATLVAVIKGDARLMPDDVTVCEGQAILIPPVYPCRILPEGGSQMELAGIDFCFKSHGSDISAALPGMPMVIAENSAKLLAKDICIVCNSAADGPNICRTMELLASGFHIAHTLSVMLGWNSNPAFCPSEDGELQALVAFLEANYHLPLTIEDIAADCNLSRRTAFEVAARHPFRTPMRILKQIRLDRSLACLRKEGVSVARVASEVGFGDARNFAREFKKRYGLTPLQYKQQSQLTIQTEALVNKAESNMEMNLSKPAAELYLQAIERASPNTDLNELHYKAGLALKQAGDNRNAKKEWAKVTALYYRLLIDLDECDYLSKVTDYEPIIEKLRRVCDYGNDRLRRRAVGQLGKWMLDCASAQKQRAAKRYSELAKELVGDSPELRPSLARTLFSTGQFRDIERYCPDQGFYVAAALRAMGEYREHLERFPEMREQCAMLHHRMGHLDEILSSYDDQPHVCVSALIDHGRAEDAITLYPQHAAKALMALERYDDILHQYPDDLQTCVFALANLGREADALAKAASSTDLTSRLLLYLDRPHDMTSTPSREFTLQIVRAATVLQVIHVLEKGDIRYGMEILDSVPSITDPDYRIGHEYYEVDLIILLIRYLLRDVCKDTVDSKWPPLTDYLGEVVERWRDCYDQRLWYDARFILNEIDESEFFSQPNRLHSESRLALAQAIKAELQDRQERAAACYQTYIEKLPPLSNSCAGGPTPVLKAFIRWRLKVLEG